MTMTKTASCQSFQEKKRYGAMDGMDDLPDLGWGSVDGYILATLTSFFFLFVCNLRRTIFLVTRWSFDIICAGLRDLC